MNSTEIHFAFIENDNGLIDLCSMLHNCQSIALDTEFLRRDTYYAKLSIIQISNGDEVFIIDALKVNLEPLKALLLDNNVLKIFHAPTQDFEILYRLFRITPKNVFDTQIAAALCDLGTSISYANLCQTICSITIDKSYQAGNWLQRPLPQNMLHYASLDVKYLHQIYNDLYNKIPDIEQYHTLVQNNLLNPKLYIMNLAGAWRKVKCNYKSHQFLGRLQMLASFREEYAALSNVPRGHFIADNDLVKMCDVLPTTTKEFARFTTKLTASHKNTLFDLCAGIRSIK